MILVTVGSQLPFDRLVGPVAAWARSRGRHDLVFQHGGGRTSLAGFREAASFKVEEMDRLFASADLVVAHVGMGTILSCLELGKPLVALPRSAQLRETRNDHQFATARRFEGRPGIFIAWDESQLDQLLDRASELAAGPRIVSTASPQLIACIRDFIHTPKS